MPGGTPVAVAAAGGPPDGATVAGGAGEAVGRARLDPVGAGEGEAMGDGVGWAGGGVACAGGGVGVGGGPGSKSAEAVALSVRVIEHVDLVPAHAPPHPAKWEPAWATAVSTTAVP